MLALCYLTLVSGNLPTCYPMPLSLCLSSVHCPLSSWNQRSSSVETLIKVQRSGRSSHHWHPARTHGYITQWSTLSSTQLIISSQRWTAPEGRSVQRTGRYSPRKRLSHGLTIFMSPQLGLFLGCFFFKHPAYIQKYTCTIQMLWHNSAIDCD